jgi:GTPase SAR1 family protein
LRTYWKNYFEKTDTLIWVVDATDRERIDDCRHELAGLLQEEVCLTTRLHNQAKFRSVFPEQACLSSRTKATFPAP